MRPSFIRAGAQAVKLEGGRARLPVIEAIIRAEIPVMGHLGLTPQSVLAMGGFKVQARNIAAADALLNAAKSLEAAGCFSFVIEGVPDVVGAAVTEAIGVPTIGIGAGPACDGQVMVFHDLLGTRRPHPAEVRAPVRRGGTDLHRGHRRLRRGRARAAPSRATPRATTARPSSATPCPERRKGIAPACRARPAEERGSVPSELG